MNIAQDLEAPISDPEFDKANKDIKIGKAPGPDVLPLLFYKTFTHILKPRFLKAFHTLQSEQNPPNQLLEAHISVTPKEGKDPNQVTNYRPISLINVDVKIYAKILAKRLVLTLEPLLNRIRSNPHIKGIQINEKTYKVAAFADDMLLFLSAPHISIPNLIQDLEHLHLISNLKMNHSKSNALNITLPPESVELCKKNFPFTWAAESIT